MKLELRGVEFVNKGAELMLYAIMEKVKEERPDTIFVMQAGPRTPSKKLADNNIHRKIPTTGLASYAKFLPKFLRDKFNLVLDHEIDAVFDGSGFAFGDQWGAAKAGKRLADHAKKWKSQGRKIIVLPQAFGPFTNEELRQKMRTIIKYADLIFARDPISYKYISEIENSSKIILRPDFTNLIKGKVPAYFNKETHEVAIIPNFKMIEVTSKEAGEAYITALKNSIDLVIKAGSKPYFLIHEGLRDKEIADQVNKMLANPIPVLVEEDSLVVKGIIGVSSAVITSRFHGLVSCLSQGVPCLATGWSHKYEMLLTDYEYAEGLIDVNLGLVELEERINSILKEPSKTEIRNKLLQKSAEQKELTKLMWKQVFSNI